jgi:hypothetical protein
MNKPSKFIAETYGTKIKVKIDHSDLSLDEVMDTFQTLIIGMGYHESSFKNWVIERANEYNETDAEDLKEKLEAWKFEDDNIVLRHRYLKDSEGYESLNELENDFFGTHDSEGYESNIDAEEEMEKEAERRMDIIGQNGNEGLHYRATKEDEDEFSNEDYEGQFEDWKSETPDENEFDDYGQRIEKDGVGFVWGDEPEDEDNLFEGDEWEANDELKDGYKKYKKALKTLSAKQKKKSK